METIPESAFFDGDIVANPHRLVIGRGGEFSHRFGGKPDIDGLSNVSGPPLHIIFDLDLADPRLSFLGFKNEKRLPLLFPLRYSGGELCYSLRPSKIEIHVWEPVDAEFDDWPYQDCPEHFEPRQADLEPIRYEDHKTFVFASLYSSNFLYPEMLSDEDRKLISDTRYPFSQIGGIQFTPNNPPYCECENPECRKMWLDLPHGAGPMMLVAAIGNHSKDGVLFWGEPQEEYVRMLFYLCPLCQAIRATSSYHS